MDEVTVRLAREEDAHAIGQLWLQLVAYHRELDEALPSASQNGAERYSQRIVDRLNDTHTQIYVAERKSGLIAGYILGVIVDVLPEMFDPEYTGFIADLYVLPDYRGQGIGKILVKAMVDWFHSQNIQHYEWYVAAQNTDGIAFWQAMKGREVMIRMRAPI